MRLSLATLGSLAPEVARPDYDRDAQAIGVVHFGLGAFHRAHQAVYTDAAMAAGDRDWGIAGLSLRSPGVRDQLAPQGGLYTVTTRSGEGEATRLVGSVKRALTAFEGEEIVNLLAAPSTHIASFTVTEKGYCRAPDGSLDFAGATSHSIYGWLELGLARRREAGLPGLTLLSCDNLPENGRVLERLLDEHLARADAGLARWVAAECAFPSTMVDRIVPATTPADLDAVERRIGLRDEAAVITEPFSQWVIEDRFAGPRPRWQAGGAQFVADVRLHETAKLRMLNGAHSALAYLGLLRRHQFVHEAIADPAIRPVVERLMRDEAAPTLEPSFDAQAYADALLARFENPALPHRLRQIAMDGSQKIPQRWLATLACHQRHGRQCLAILQALAAWIVHVRGDGAPVDDPLADRLAALWREEGESGIVAVLFGANGLFAADWQANDDDRQAIEGWLGQEIPH
ncbi:MAG: mannitol dehydrogenase family protein [Porphyrobacter sp.]|nr:mannitol dehydrogenase family protein [Porphyrobacter sp.]